LSCASTHKLILSCCCEGVAMLCALFLFTCFPMEALRWLRIMGGGAWGPRTVAWGAASAISLEWP
ncbi:hypothetical protein BDZ91DRAFT_724989, partial [Kalaharituber pfeilii]